jgi:hypothetical protein
MLHGANILSNPYEIKQRNAEQNESKARKPAA